MLRKLIMFHYVSDFTRHPQGCVPIKDCYAQIPKTRTASFWIESIDYLGDKLLQLLPPEIKQSRNLNIFNNVSSTEKVTYATADSARIIIRHLTCRYTLYIVLI